MSEPTPSLSPATSRRAWWGLAVLSLGVSMIIVDATIVSVIVPQIIDDIGITFTDAEWINSIYALVFAALLITMGRAGDIWGRRRLFLVGLVVFVAASVLAAASDSGPQLIVARLIQGVGGAMILPSTLSTVNALFRGRQRAIAFGIWGSVIGGMAAVGPLLGGWLATSYSWAWAFLINVPIGLVCLLGALALVPETRDEKTSRDFDWLGVLLSAISLGMLVFTLIEGRTYGWWKPIADFEVAGLTWSTSAPTSPVPVAFAISLACALLFFRHQATRERHGRAVLFDVTLFRFRSFGYGNVAALIVSLGEFGIIFTLPLFLQFVLGFDALQTGWVFMGIALGAFVAGPTAAALSQRYGPRRVVILGMALEVVGILGAALLIRPDVSGALLTVPLFVYGIGVGYATAQLTSVILMEVPTYKSGQASGMQSTSRQVGSALGIAVLGTALAVLLSAGLDDELDQVPGLDDTQQEFLSTAITDSGGNVDAAIAAAVATGVLTAEEARSSGAAIVSASHQASADATRGAQLFAAGFVLCGLVAATRLPDIRTTAATNGRPGDSPAAGPPGAAGAAGDRAHTEGPNPE